MLDVLDTNQQEINMLIQWGKRMLSLVDLIKLGTMPLEVATFLMEGMRNGASVLIGAQPSGAGKTTLMGSLLGVIPSSDRIITIENASMIQGLTQGTLESPKTHVIHEISRRHSWGHYLGGSVVVKVTQLIDPYTRLATNLHSDSIERVKATFRRFGFEDAVKVFNFIIFLQYNYDTRLRVVDEIWEFDKLKNSFKVVYSNTKRARSELVDILK